MYPKLHKFDLFAEVVHHVASGVLVTDGFILNCDAMNFLLMNKEGELPSWFTDIITNF